MVYREGLGWQPLGHIVSTGQPPYVCAPPDWQREVVTWARQYGKSAGVLTATIEASLTGIHTLVDSLFANHQAQRDRRVRRLADDLGLWPETARSQFDAVERVLEAAGVGDGYGRLSLTQPVRPPVPPPVVPELVRRYPDPYERAATPSTTGFPLTLCSAIPRPRTN
ncbi:hypothetical protein [Streptomyces sp. NPDC046909]|uniref:hypothetical protein n=1 Tax=Streptomyces sp. NPDC046909 TaxID=3155617 RepID=UPI0033F7A9B5